MAGVGRISFLYVDENNKRIRGVEPLESLQLLEKGEKLYAACYIFLSVAGCIAGVWAERNLAKEG